uniref:Serine protease inhibitor n=1 Tax=Amblyomma americanum TaxID=6943 RepID=A0A0E9Y2X0_AMBAM
MSAAIDPRPAQPTQNDPAMSRLLWLVSVAVMALAAEPDEDGRWKLARANNFLGLNLLKALPSNANTNVFFSPYSVATAMGMAYAGARGDTLEQLTLNFGYAADELNEQKVLALFREQLDASRELPHEYTLDVANAAVAQEGYGVLPNYTDALMSSFGAEYIEADFSKKGEEAVEKINNWVSDKTHGKIRRLFDEPPDFSTRLILLNAVYYKGTWLYEFNKARTKPRSFYNGGVTKVLVPMMKMKSTLNHTFDATLNADVVDLPYVGIDFAMTILLPSERNGLEHLKSVLTTQTLNRAIARMYPKDMKFRMPKLKLDTKYTLKPTLESMGIKKIFSADADLSGISGAKNLYVSDVLHKAVLEVNEEGSEAAAVTGFVIQLRTAAFVTPPPLPKVYVDHPFIFLIRNVNTNCIMFLGEINAL